METAELATVAAVGRVLWGVMQNVCVAWCLEQGCCASDIALGDSCCHLLRPCIVVVLVALFLDGMLIAAYCGGAPQRART